MYTAYWNLVEKPFQNVADSRFAFLSDQHREGLARLLYLVDGRKLGGILVGDYGVGKSMVLELLARRLADKKNVRFLKIDTPPAGNLSLSRLLALRIGLSVPADDSAVLLNAIEEKFSQDNNPHHLVLALDEAQFIQHQSDREFLHLLTNLRLRQDSAGGENVLTLILAGHERLTAFIAEDTALSQRFQLYWKIDPFDATQTVEYVHVRIRAAGGDIWMFDEDSLTVLAEASKGYPRLINNICDIALLMGCAARSPKITADIMSRAVQEMQSPLMAAGIGGFNREEKHHE